MSEIVLIDSEEKLLHYFGQPCPPLDSDLQFIEYYLKRPRRVPGLKISEKHPTALVWRICVGDGDWVVSLIGTSMDEWRIQMRCRKRRRRKAFRRECQ